MASKRALLVSALALLFLACLAWELYDPPGEEAKVLSFTIEEFETQTPWGEASLGSCYLEVSAFIDPGRPGLAIKVKLLCTLSKAPPPAISLLYASNISCYITVELSGSRAAEEELPVGGVILKAPGTPYQLLDEHDVEAEALESASGLISLSIRARLIGPGGEELTSGGVEKTLLIPPSWALPLTLSVACATALLCWFYVRRATAST